MLPPPRQPGTRAGANPHLDEAEHPAAMAAPHALPRSTSSRLRNRDVVDGRPEGGRLPGRPCAPASIWP